METNAAISFEQAKKLFDQHNYEASKMLFLELLQGHYQEANCHFYIGLIYLNLQNYEQAITHLSACKNLDPQNFNCVYYLGFIAELQKNDDLALHYYYKTLSIKPGHTRSLDAIQRLSGGHENIPHPLSTQHDGQAHSNTGVHHDAPPPFHGAKGQSHNQVKGHDNSSNDHAQEPVHRETPDKGHSNDNRDQSETISKVDLIKDPLLLYDELIESNDRDSQIAVDMIKATRIIKRRPRVSAYLSTILLQVVVLPVLLTFFYFRFILPFMGIHSEAAAVRSLWIFYLVVTGSFLIYLLVKIKTTIVTIDGGFIEITKGVFSRTKMIFLNHKADHFGTHQNFFNLITGDSTLLFDLDTGHHGKVKLTGLAKIKETDTLSKNLQTLRYQLRNTPVIKSGIFG